MTVQPTIAKKPIPRGKFSKPASRPQEIRGTLKQRFGVPIRHAPVNLEGLVQSVEQALKEHKELRIIGAGRGLSAATCPIGTLVISTEKLKKIYAGRGRDILGLRRLRGVHVGSIARMQAGVPARTVLTKLTSETAPRSLITHGSGDFQSIVGALSTGTHGTGPFPSLAGLVRALVVVRVDDSSGTPVPRVELIQRSQQASGAQLPCYRAPRGGAWRTKSGLLVHPVFDDDIFFAHTVGLGCLGLVYCVTMDVIEAVPLMEESRIAYRLDDTLAKVRADCGLEGVRCEFVVDPYPRDTTRSSNPKRWDDVVDFPPSRDFSMFRAQYIRRGFSDAPRPRGSLPFSMTLGRKKIAAEMIGARIGGVLENPIRNAPDGVANMIQCSEVRSYIDWLPQILMLNLKYRGTGAEWAVPNNKLEEAIWAVLQETNRVYQAFLPGSDKHGHWEGSEEQLIALLATYAPVYSGPAVRFVAGEGSLLAGSNALGRDGEVPLWNTIEVGFLGRPDIEDAWSPRKRWAGLRPEEPIPLDRMEELLGALDAADATTPSGQVWEPAEDLDKVRGREKRSDMRLFAAYEHGRIATMNRMTAALCNEQIGGRPHQGLYNGMTWQEVKEGWPKTADTWLERFKIANPVGTFNSELTARWGIGAPLSGSGPTT